MYKWILTGKRLIVCIPLLFSLQLFSQNFSAATSKNKVGVGEQFKISFTLDASGSNFRAPTMPDFDLYSGPNQSSSMQFINGNVSQSISYSFVLAAKKEGKFTIGPATVSVNGKTMETKPLTIEVVKGATSQQQGGNNGGQQQPKASSDISQNLFLKR